MNMDSLISKLFTLNMPYIAVPNLNFESNSGEDAHSTDNVPRWVFQYHIRLQSPGSDWSHVGRLYTIKHIQAICKRRLRYLTWRVLAAAYNTTVVVFTSRCLSEFIFSSQRCFSSYGVPGVYLMNHGVQKTRFTHDYWYITQDTISSLFSAQWSIVDRELSFNILNRDLAVIWRLE